MATLPMLPYGNSKHNQKKIEVLADRVIVFVIPGLARAGTQPNEIRFPWPGELIDIYATCRIPGSTETVMKVQRISEFNFRNDTTKWVDVTNQFSFKAYERIQDPLLQLINTQVNPKDHFRVVVSQLGAGIQDITIQATIRTDFLR